MDIILVLIKVKKEVDDTIKGDSEIYTLSDALFFISRKLYHKATFETIKDLQIIITFCLSK